MGYAISSIAELRALLGVGTAVAIASSAAVALAEPSETALESLKLDIAVFQPDGVVERWIPLNRVKCLKVFSLTRVQLMN